MQCFAFEKRIESWWCSVLELICGSYSSDAGGCNAMSLVGWSPIFWRTKARLPSASGSI